jgi:hypothetical protein
MPPPGSPQPPPKDVDSFVAWMENTLDSAAGGSPAKGTKAGYVPVQRLNRTEYAASVKTLVGVDVNPKDVLPQDSRWGPTTSRRPEPRPPFLDQYVTAARQSRSSPWAIPIQSVSSEVLDRRQPNPDDPPPPGTRDGNFAQHDFRPTASIASRSMKIAPAMPDENMVVIMIDDRIVFRKSVGGAADLLVDRTAGTDAFRSWNASKMPVQV